MARPLKEVTEPGVCATCRKAPRSPGISICQPCRTKRNDRVRNLKRRQFAERKAAGLCVKCSAPHDSKTSHCVDCLAVRKQRTVTLSANNLCLLCRDPLTNGLKYCRPCLEIYSVKHRARAARLKAEVLNHYGRVCQCCRESNQAFLTIDHIDGGGTKHRKEATNGKGGEAFYRLLKQQSFPQGYRVLCFNCNFAIWRLGKFPHQEKEFLSA